MVIERVSIGNKGKDNEVAHSEKVKVYFKSKPNDSASDRKMQA